MRYVWIAFHTKKNTHIHRTTTIFWLIVFHIRLYYHRWRPKCIYPCMYSVFKVIWGSTFMFNNAGMLPLDSYFYYIICWVRVHCTVIFHWFQDIFFYKCTPFAISIVLVLSLYLVYMFWKRSKRVVDLNTIWRFRCSQPDLEQQ